MIKERGWERKKREDDRRRMNSRMISQLIRHPSKQNVPQTRQCTTHRSVARLTLFSCEVSTPRFRTLRPTTQRYGGLQVIKDNIELYTKVITECSEPNKEKAKDTELERIWNHGNWGRRGPGIRGSRRAKERIAKQEEWLEKFTHPPHEWKECQNIHVNFDKIDLWKWTWDNVT